MIFLYFIAISVINNNYQSVHGNTRLIDCNHGSINRLNRLTNGLIVNATCGTIVILYIWGTNLTVGQLVPPSPMAWPTFNLWGLLLYLVELLKPGKTNGWDDAVLLDTETWLADFYAVLVVAGGWPSNYRTLPRGRGFSGASASQPLPLLAAPRGRFSRAPEQNQNTRRGEASGPMAVREQRYAAKPGPPWLTQSPPPAARRRPQPASQPASYSS